MVLLCQSTAALVAVLFARAGHGAAVGAPTCPAGAACARGLSGAGVGATSETLLVQRGFKASTDHSDAESGEASMQIEASAEVLAQQSRTNATSWPSQGQWPWWPPHWPIWQPMTAPPTPAPYVPQPLEPAPPLADDIPIKLMTFNVYYAQLGASERLDGISSAISQMQADIAVITEQWHEKPRILERVREKSGRNYAFCNGGNFQEETWDGDIMYDADKWEALTDDVLDLGRDRGLSWAVLRHRATGKRLLVYGIHPLCCGNEQAHLDNAMAFAQHLQARTERPETPVVIMGDFNAPEHWDSTKLYKGKEVHAFNRNWKLPVAFDDAFRVPQSNWYKDATTHNSGSRLDYIFTERRSPPAFRVDSASIWRSPPPPGRSDHYPIIADVVLRR
mmetsp:Transcript_45645/g.109343  ORF Transcript_45645/g.109343 Transcript_45645/m.109343 type:complete len:392 (+) Transcript_45645:68-1243(+)